MIRMATLVLLAGLFSGCEPSPEAKLAVQHDQHRKAIAEPPSAPADEPPPLTPPTRPVLKVLEVAPAPRPRLAEPAQP